jgi:hypothetical protein
MPECDSGIYTTEFQGSGSTSRDTDVPGTISLRSSLDGISCSGLVDVRAHVDQVVQASYTSESGDSGNLEFIQLSSELTFNGLQVSASASVGPGGPSGGGSISVQGNTVTYSQKFPDNPSPEYTGFDIEGTALAITSVVQRDTALFRINGNDYAIDNVIDVSSGEVQ